MKIFSKDMTRCLLSLLLSVGLWVGTFSHPARAATVSAPSEQVSAQPEQLETAGTTRYSKAQLGKI